MSHKIIKPEGIELIEYLNNGYAICNRCGAVMRQAEDPKTGCGVYICPSCGLKVDEEDYDSESERLLFYDLSSKKYFRTTMAAVLNAQYHVNRNLAIRGDCSLNEYLSFLGVEGIDGGDDLGWDISYMVEEMDCYWLDFDNYKSTLEDGLECIIIDTMAVNKFE